jgi:hypothetical protein
MTDTSPLYELRLDHAQAELQEIFRQNQGTDSTLDVGSLGRIHAHIVNIDRSVRASTRDCANASKRLNDFATTIARMAKRVATPNADLTARLARLSEILQTAGAQLARYVEPPKAVV